MQKGIKQGLMLFKSGNFCPHQFFQKNFKKVLTRKKNFAIITFVAPQGSNEAANAARLLKGLKT